MRQAKTGPCWEDPGRRYADETNFTKKGGHFGNDIAVKKGVPFVAVESGTVEKCEKLQNSVANLELKSFDGMRKYCYYNCDEKKPFANGIEKGSVVFAGQILGYVGADDFCNKGGSKILRCPYLHFAIKIKINDKDDFKEIFVNPFNILKFLENNKSYLIGSGENSLQKYFFEDEVYLKFKNRF